MIVAIAPQSSTVVQQLPVPYLEVLGLTKCFGSATILDDLSLTVAKGEFLSLLGPSGCGKTTLLRMIAGLLSAETGKIAVGNRDLTRVPAHKRNIGVVFQNYALFPHLTVAENVAFGLSAKGLPKDEIARRVDNVLGLVRMQDFAQRSIAALSGGQQQRIAVARAVVVEPSLLLLDEPFSALDRKLRETMQIELRGILRDLGITSIFVTHDQDEALVMSDRIAVMNSGRIEHMGTPAEIYSTPKTLFALEFVGQSTRIFGRVINSRDGQVEVQTDYGQIRAPGNFIPGSKVVVAARPETALLGEGCESGFNTIYLQLTDMIYLGTRTSLHFKSSPSEQIIADVSRLPPGGLERGARLPVRWPISDMMVFPHP
jgi:putative spermidine/putrescine transport system ATP-binding protein